MTPKDLSRLYWLNKEIEREKQRLAELEAVATGTSAKISGLPHADGIADKTALAAEIADAKTIIEAKVKESIAEYNRLIRYVAGVDDPIVREIIMYRYVDMMSWRDVEIRIGGGNIADSLKKRLYRYLSRK